MKKQLNPAELDLQSNYLKNGFLINNFNKMIGRRMENS